MSIHRVSSRQRLVSWDAFDASTVSYDLDDVQAVAVAVAAFNDYGAKGELPVVSKYRIGSTVIVPPDQHTTTSTTNGNHSADRSSSSSTVNTNVIHANDSDDDDDDDDSCGGGGGYLDLKRKRREGCDTTTITTTTSISSTTSATKMTSIRDLFGALTPTSQVTTLSPQLIHPSPHYHHHYYWSTSTKTTTAQPQVLQLIHLPIEVQCIMYQYLTIQELRNMTQVCRPLRQSLLLLQPSPQPQGRTTRDETNTTTTADGDASIVESAVWKPLCIHQYWPCLQPPLPTTNSNKSREDETEDEPSSPQPLSWIISTTTPTAIFDDNNNNDDYYNNYCCTKNYPMILSMAVRDIPTHIDTTVFPSSRRHLFVLNHPLPPVVDRDQRQQQRYLPGQQLLVVRPNSIVSMNCTVEVTTTTTTPNSNCIHQYGHHRQQSTTKRQSHHHQQQVIQFMGTVGLGDQCIRSNAPFPRPKKRSATTSTTATLTSRRNDNNSHWKSIIMMSRNHHSPSPATSSLFQRVFRNNIVRPTSATGDESTPVADNNNSSVLFCPLRRSARIAANQLSSYPSIASRTRNSSSGSRLSHEYRPFCAPFLTRHYEMSFAPRFIAYYEVTILPLPEANDNNKNTSIKTSTTSRSHDIIGGTTTITTASIQYPPSPQQQSLDEVATSFTTSPNNMMNQMAATTGGDTSISDCVAIGVGTENFPLQHRMPGWDSNSYGYHGDDGGIFHGNGSMIQQYHVKFGVNDTIGCGIDYIQKSIFFTLNGTFLGYAFKLCPQHIDVDLYPIVGMDTQYPILCNFGCHQSPFVFDLQTMIQQHESIIQDHLLLE